MPVSMMPLLYCQDDFVNVGELMGEIRPTIDANDMVANTAYVSADSAPPPAPQKKGTTKRTKRKGSAYDGFGGGDAPAPTPSQPKKGIAKRTERSGSTYDGFATADTDAEDNMRKWLSAPAASKDAADLALQHASGGDGSFCFREGSSGLVMCALYGNGQVGHFRLQPQVIGGPCTLGLLLSGGALGCFGVYIVCAVF